MARETMAGLQERLGGVGYNWGLCGIVRTATDSTPPLPIDPVYERTVTMTKSPRHVITITCSLCCHTNEDQPKFLSLCDLDVNY